MIGKWKLSKSKLDLHNLDKSAWCVRLLVETICRFISRCNVDYNEHDGFVQCQTSSRWFERHPSRGLCHLIFLRSKKQVSFVWTVVSWLVVFLEIMVGTQCLSSIVTLARVFSVIQTSRDVPQVQVLAIEIKAVESLLAHRREVCKLQLLIALGL